MSDPISGVLPPIDRSTAAIESAFLGAGEGLSRGLAAFGALNDGLVALGAELGSGASATASASLDRLSRSIAAIAERLPADAEVLSQLVESNGAITARFASLTDSMRMITIISRSARIEAVAFDDDRLGLDSFTRAISQQISDVQRDIHGCAAEHAKLTALLGDAAQTQAAFEAAFGGKLLALAGELGDASGVIRRRREEGSALMRDVAARSVRISRAAGSALVSLQVGDATRQRLEHIAQAVKAASGDTVGRAASAAFCRLGAAQLRDTAVCLDGEAAGILQSLGVVSDETRELVAVGTATYGRGSDGSESFMTEFRSRFALAMDLVQTCEATRQTVERSIAELRSMLEALSGTISTLGATSRELVLVGMNVGLKAARLGSEGRSLVVVAEELKRLAGDISAHAHELLPVFERVQQLSHHFDQDGGDASGRLDREFQLIVDDLDRGDAKVADQLRSLAGTGRDFAARLAEARRAFEEVAGMRRVLDEAAGQLQLTAERAAPAAADLPEAAERVDALMMPLYTMAREREVHAAAVAALSGASAARPALAA